MDRISQRIASELGVSVGQVIAAAELMQEGATVPFIARYRKEKTGGLDDTQLRKLEARLAYLRELEDRRGTVLRSIEQQGKLTHELALLVNAAQSKVELEDLYAPHRPKRRSKAQIARAAGLEPLADALLANPALHPNGEASKYIDASKGVADAKAALEGARQILIERMGEAPKLVGDLREWQWREGVIAARVAKGKDAEGAKFSDYFDFSQNIKELPSHRALALLRGYNEGILTLDLDVPHDDAKAHPAEGKIRLAFAIADRGRPSDAWLAETARLAWRSRLAEALKSDLLARLKERADADATAIFAKNVEDLLLAAPAGARVTMGLDPGYRTGVKRAEERLAWRTCDPGGALPKAQGGTCKRWQRDRQPRDG
jgi:protein Tex